MHCIALYCIAWYCTILYFNALHCICAWLVLQTLSRGTISQLVLGVPGFLGLWLYCTVLYCILFLVSWHVDTGTRHHQLVRTGSSRVLGASACIVSHTVNWTNLLVTRTVNRTFLWRAQWTGLSCDTRSEQDVFFFVFFLTRSVDMTFFKTHTMNLTFLWHAQ